MVAVLWGVNFPATTLGLQHFPPLFMVAVRFTLIAVPTILLVPRPQVPLRWFLGMAIGTGTVQFGLLYVAMAVGMPPGLASLVLQACARSPCCSVRCGCVSTSADGRWSASWPPSPG